MSAIGMSMLEMQVSDSKEGTAKLQGTPLKNSLEQGESLSSIHNTLLQKKMSLIASRGLQSAMARIALSNSNGLLLKVIIELFKLTMKTIQLFTLVRKFLDSIRLNSPGY